MIKTTSLGFPRIGANRELKKSVENYWKNPTNDADLQNTAKNIRLNNWKLHQQFGIDYIPSNDFSFYDHVLDNIALFGAIPERFKTNFKFNLGEKVNLDLLFAMARGCQQNNIDITALEMTKWFYTNYHYLVAEFSKNQQFKLSATKIFDEFVEAKNHGIITRPVIIGPVSFLLLGKTLTEFNRFELLDNLLNSYFDLFDKLAKIGVVDVQIDEPFLVTDLSKEAIEAFKYSYKLLNKNKKSIKLHLATYFEALGDNAELAFSLETESVHVDLVRGEKQFDNVLNLVKNHQILSLGVVDGRNIWINNLEKSINLVKKAIAKISKDRIIVGPSCQLLHVPVDLDLETNLDDEIKSWLCFAKQKLQEIQIIAKVASGDEISYKKNLEANAKAISNRNSSTRIHNQKVKERLKTINAEILNRTSNYDKRKQLQKQLNLPILPTTTIGSFPQTKEVRKARADFKAGALTLKDYNNFVQQEIKKSIDFQHEIDLDVLVHGEFERNDMVEYFGEQLNGFCFTKNGWVQSYGSRCVKPPIIFGDVSRNKEMTVEWAKYAQSLTQKIMKGMLTGPITILQWSFVRDDQSRKDTAFQIAFAIRDEVLDLEKAGIKIIQIDEAALREGLPIRQKNWQEYLQWAVDAFRISASVANDKTQIHTHMCYSEFNDIISAIANMDADVISIETSRSQMELLNAFINFKYPNEIGPGVYDIHSPRVPSSNEIEILLNKALKVLKPEQIWVNPDCGLKTRDWNETKIALKTMVEATKKIRKSL